MTRHVRVITGENRTARLCAHGRLDKAIREEGGLVGGKSVNVGGLDVFVAGAA